MPTAGNPQSVPLPSPSGSGPEERPNRLSGTSATRPPRLVAAARAVASAPVVTILGWLVLLVPAYWSLVDDNGQWLFKLDSFVYYEAVHQWLDGGDLYSWYANPGQHLWPFTYTPLAAWVSTALNIGVSIGSLLAGQATDAGGSRAGYLAVAAFAWGAVVVGLLGLPALRRARTSGSLGGH